MMGMMNISHIKICITILLTASVFTGCSNSKKMLDDGNKIVRKPITEVAESELKQDNRLIDALMLQQTGRNDEALEAYAAIASDNNQCATAWYGMARLLIQQRWLDSAQHCAERAVGIDGENIWYRQTLVGINKMRGDAKGAASQLEAIVKLQPNVLEHYYDLSNTYLESNDIVAAVEVLDRVEHRIGITEPISMQKQRLWAAAGETVKAQKEMERLAEAMPQEKRFQAILAEMNMKRGNLKKAKEYYDRIAQNHPDDEYIHLQLAEFYKQNRQPEQADHELLLAFDNPKLECKTKLQFLTSFYTPEEFYNSHGKTVLQLLDKVEQTCNDSIEYALLKGDVLMHQDRYAEAAKWLERGLIADSSRFVVWEGLLICLSQLPERNADLQNAASRAERLFPMHTLPYYLQAVTLVEKKEYALALKKLVSASRWGFHKGYLEFETLSIMAECYYRLGIYEKAWSAFEQCLRLKPNDAMLLNNYAYYLSERGQDLTRAEQMSAKSLEIEPDDANSLDTYAWILHLTGRDKEAMPYMERAIDSDPQSETLQHHMAEIKKALQK